jgi:hypothetical protein
VSRTNRRAAAAAVGSGWYAALATRSSGPTRLSDLEAAVDLPAGYLTPR